MAKISPKKLTRHFWTEESGLTSMMILLFVSDFVVIPFFSKRQLINFTVRIFWVVVLFARITTMSESKKQMRYFSILPVLLLAVNFIRFFRDIEFLAYVDFLVDIATFLLLIGMVFIKVFERGPVTIHRIVGAVVGYMLIGNLWAVLYTFIYNHIPGSLQLNISGADTIVTPATFMYFSYTTLTTTGYGDILPVLPVTRSLALIEQLIGVFYPAILIGRLVSLTAGRNESSGKD
jgi:hypothetical protein